MITINNEKPWYLKPPTLYRYENQDRITDFFTNGKLRLSSFSNYKKYQDNELGDKEEGRTVYQQLDSIGRIFDVGQNAYTFCTSLKYDDSLKNEFKRDGCFKIIDPTNFGITISNHLNNLIEGIEGYCIYLPVKVVTKYDFKYRSASELAEAVKSKDFDLMNEISNIGKDNVNNYFYKHLRYSYQQEYRFIFIVDKIVDSSIDIVCPDAIQFCRIIKDGEIGDL